jgi:hypothetical protein
MAAKQRARGRTGLNEASIGELLKVRDKWCATTTPRQPISFVALKKLDWRPRPGCRAHIHENSERDFSGMGTGKKWKQRAKKLDEKSIGHVNDIMEKARTPLHCIRITNSRSAPSPSLSPFGARLQMFGEDLTNNPTKEQMAELHRIISQPKPPPGNKVLPSDLEALCQQPASETKKWMMVRAIRSGQHQG